MPAKPLNDWLVLLEQRHPQDIDLGLERCGTVYRKLGSPRPADKVFTVAGTNGKGSTVAYLAAMSAALGQRCGTYTSPHIHTFNERISVMGVAVSDELLVQAFEQVEAARGPVSLTYFEFTTLAAFLILKQAQLDVAVLEVGLGGRLDTVNLVDADCAVITPIGLDHQDFLGPDIASIATEKAGIIRADTAVVCTETQPPGPVAEIAAGLAAPIYRRGTEFNLLDEGGEQLKFSIAGKVFKFPRPPMGGKHQLDNLATALAAILLLNPVLVTDADGGSLSALAELGMAIENCKLPGRLQQLAASPDIFVDVGHNALAAEVIAAYFRGRPATEVTCVLAMLADKPAEAVALVLNDVVTHWLCADSDGSRGQTGERLAQRLRVVLPAAKISHFSRPARAMDAALSMAAGQDTILAFGSFTTASAVLEWQENSLGRDGHDAVH